MYKQANSASTALDKFLRADMIPELCVDPSVIETDHTEIMWSLKFTERLFPDAVVMLCNARHKSMDYVSENFTTLFEYPSSFFKTISNEDYFAIVHPDDVEALSLCFMEMVRATAGIRQDEIKEKRFILHYRIKHAKGYYVYIEDEKLTLESRKFRQVGLTVMRDVTSTLNFPGVKLESFRYVRNKLIKVSEYFPAKQNTRVTSREAEILRLLKKGFKSQEIADQLSISIHTVKNHKKNLFKKTNARNSRQLLNFVNP